MPLGDNHEIGPEIADAKTTQIHFPDGWLRNTAVLSATVALAISANGCVEDGAPEQLKDKNLNAQLKDEKPPSLSPQAIENIFKKAEERLKADSAPNQKTYPDVEDPDNKGHWLYRGEKTWTSGFYPGCQWLVFEETQDEEAKQLAQSYTEGLKEQQYSTASHDVGFQIQTSFGNGYRITGNQEYKQVMLNAAASLATRYDPDVGAIRSWGNKDNEEGFKMIVDNMMNLELLFAAARLPGGNPKWAEMAEQHAITTAETHVRDDGSTYQLVNFDPETGRVASKASVQGYKKETTWSRGQAWAIGGFTIAYRETNNPALLDTARKTADYFLDNLPDDYVPEWDFEAPKPMPSNPIKDSSAAAIAASSLLELSEIEQDQDRQERYFKGAENILRSLASKKYFSEHGDMLIEHGAPKKKVGSTDQGTVYGDYYFLLSLKRYQEATN